MFTSETKLIVRYVETDRMGIVHHSNYAIWFEIGRTDFIKKLGKPYSVIEAEGSILPLVGLSCSFKEYAEYEDCLVVKTRIQKYTGVRLIFYYEVVREDNGKIIATGETEHAWTTPELKPVNLKKYRPELHNLLKAAMPG